MSLAEWLAALIVLALNAYALLAGADFGGGVWDFLASGPRRREQRELIADAIGPIWEANHVWLIFAVVLLFSCFPAAFARLTTTLHVPLVLLLTGIVLRGSAFTFRSYGPDDDAVRLRWGAVFSAASVIAPLLLGASIGAIASGRVVAPHGGFMAGYIAPWATPFALSLGALTLALFAFLAAVYLTVEARERALQEDFRRRALWSGGITAALAIAALVLARGAASRMHASLTGSAWSHPVQFAAAAAAVTATAALIGRRYQLARAAACALVSLVLWGWALAQRPYIIPPDLTVAGSAAPASTLRFVLLGSLGGGIILLPSLACLYLIFKGGRSRTAHD